MSSRELTATTNPFSTRYVRPGALRFLFEPGIQPESLVARLAARGWRGQILGPHGSGKSTLLAALRTPLARAGQRLCEFALHDRQRRLPFEWLRLASAQRATLIVIDGFEQLNAWNRLLVRWHCRRSGRGLLVTTHRDLGLPTLYETRTSVHLAQCLAAELLSAQQGALPNEVIAQCFAAARGDMRETLFALYDRFESQRSAAAQEPRA